MLQNLRPLNTKFDQNLIKFSIDRLSVAMKIDKMSHDKKKETVEKNWFKENVIYFRH